MSESRAKVAAIWCRVSTHDQRELSLDSQEVAVRKVMEAQGYEVPPQYVVKVDWTSMDLMSCPEFQQVRQWIKSGEVQAVGVLDRDRLQAQGLQRLVFLSECKDRGVPIIPVQGPPLLEEPEGQLVELALAIGKERSVLRAQQGARDGLRDRARLRGLPAVPKNPYGYVWDAKKTGLIPTADWPTVEMICRSALVGMPIRALVKELHRRGTATPTGKEWWAPRTIHAILTRPVYAGRYYALRQTSIEPQHRRAQTYGKSSNRLKPLAEAVHLANISIERPPLTWDEWLALQDKLKANKLQAQRNGMQDYLLRSLIICDMHRRRYHGRKKGNTYLYACSTTCDPGHQPCPRPKLSRVVEDHVKALCRKVLENPDIIEREVESRAGTVKATRQSLQKSLASLDRKHERALDTETNLALEKARGNVSAEAYQRALARIRAERTWGTEERQRVQTQLKTLDQGLAALQGLAHVREQIAQKLTSASHDDWRMILGALGVDIHVGEQGAIEVGLAIPVAPGPIVSHTPGGHPQTPVRRGFAPSALPRARVIG